MKIHLECNGFALTPAIKERVERKIGALSKPLKRFEAHGDLLAYVEVGRTTKHHKNGDVFQAALNIIGLPGKIFRAENRNLNLFAALDSVKNKVWDDLVKYKRLAVKRSKRGYRWVEKTLNLSRL